MFDFLFPTWYTQWRDRLATALHKLKVGRSAEQVLHPVSKTNGSVDDKDELPVIKVLVYSCVF